MKRPGLLLLHPLTGILVHHKVIPEHFVGFSLQFTSTHLFSRVDRGTVRVDWFSQEHNALTPPGLEPGPLDPASCALTTFSHFPTLNYEDDPQPQPLLRVNANTLRAFENT